MTKDEIKQIKVILRNLISSELKKYDAPCSSQCHFDAAIYGLTKLIPKFNPSMFIEAWTTQEDKKQILEMFALAKEEVESYNPLRK